MSQTDNISWFQAPSDNESFDGSFDGEESYGDSVGKDDGLFAVGFLLEICLSIFCCVLVVFVVWLMFYINEFLKVNVWSLN